MDQPTLQLADRTYCVPRVVSSSVTLPKPRWTGVILFLILAISAAVPFANYVRSVGESGNFALLRWLALVLPLSIMAGILAFGRLARGTVSAPAEVCLVPTPTGVFRVFTSIRKGDHIYTSSPGWLTLGPNGMEFHGMHFDFRLGAAEVRRITMSAGPQISLTKPDIGPRFTIRLVVIGDDYLPGSKQVHESLRGHLKELNFCSDPLYPPFWRYRTPDGIPRKPLAWWLLAGVMVGLISYCASLLILQKEPDMWSALFAMAAMSLCSALLYAFPPLVRWAEQSDLKKYRTQHEKWLARNARKG